MDDFKRENRYDYDSWDMNCKCIIENAKNKKKLKDLFKRRARRRLKRRTEEN